MAYEFNGTNQRLVTTSAPVTQEPLTIAAWFWPNNLTQLAVIASLADTDGATSGAQMYYGLYLFGNVAGDPIDANKHNGAGASGAFAGATSTSGATVNAWNHGCAVFTSNTSRTVYLNGGSSATNTTNIGNVGSAVNRVAIGVVGRSTPTEHFNGRVAEVGIWDVALSAEDAAALADGMSCDKVRPDRLVYYSPLVRDLSDYSGGLTITNNNTATVANHPRVYA